METFLSASHAPVRHAWLPFCCHSAEALLHLFMHTCIHSPITVVYKSCLPARFLFRPGKNRPSCRCWLPTSAPDIRHSLLPASRRTDLTSVLDQELSPAPPGPLAQSASSLPSLPSAEPLHGRFQPVSVIPLQVSFFTHLALHVGPFQTRDTCCYETLESHKTAAQKKVFVCSSLYT